jgi:hypothetical protein
VIVDERPSRRNIKINVAVVAVVVVVVVAVAVAPWMNVLLSIFERQP